MTVGHAVVPAPTYRAALRILVDRAFGRPLPVPSIALPGGPFPDRVASLPTTAEQAEALVLCRGVELSPETASLVEPEEYWTLALARRFVIHGPLGDIADSDLPAEVRDRVERRLLGVYYKRYNAIPLPEDLLALLLDHQRREPGDQLVEWLEMARNLILPAPSPGEARRRRIRLRAEAIRRLSSGRCSEGGTNLAEFFVDLISLSHSVRLDVERAISTAGKHQGSVSRSWKALTEAEDTEMERMLGHLRWASLTLDDFPRPEHEGVLDRVARRAPPAMEALLFKPADHGGDRSGPASYRTPSMPATNPGATTGREAMDPRVLFREVRSRIAARVIGRTDLCSRLALAGVAHLLGVTNQRILLCGTTGSGKSHAAAALAEALDRTHMRVDMSDFSATGWKGADVPEMLQSLADRSTQNLEGSVLILDEVDKVRVTAGTEGNSLQAQVQLQSSLLSLIDGATSTTDGVGVQQLDTSRLLVIGTGAFGGEFLGPPTTAELVRWGWIPELAARWGERLYLGPPTRAEARDLLEKSDRSVSRKLGPLAKGLGIEIVIPAETLGYVVNRWFETGADFRSASEWLLAAARARLLAVLEDDASPSIVLAPDDVARASHEVGQS